MPSDRAVVGKARVRDGRYAWVVLALLCVVYVLNFLDRQLATILANPIQDDLGISDGQLGRLGGLYFALFYCVLAVPVAWLADRGNRVRILTIVCALWSTATIACGMAHSYPQLALARISVGMGEAGGVPGIFLSGRLIERFAVRSPRIYGLLPGLALAVAIRFFISFVRAPAWPVALAFLAVPTFFNYFYPTPAVTLVQNAVPATQRTLAGAALLPIMSLIGLGLDPTRVGAVSDWFHASHPATSLQLAFYSLMPFYLVAIGLHLALARHLGPKRSARDGGAL